MSLLFDLTSLCVYLNHRKVKFEGFDETVYCSFICLNEIDHGSVISVRNEEGYPVRFLNTSIVQLAEYLLIFREHLEWTLEHRPSFDDEVKYGREVGRILRHLDPAAAQVGGEWDDEITRVENAM
jgi:hypothetical protein